IDIQPKKLIKKILKAKVVYSSSLHGIIFSHALNKECVFVAPQSDEPLFKFEDYYLSIGIEMPKPLPNIHHANFRTDISTVLGKEISKKDFYFPDKPYLLKKGIIY